MSLSRGARSPASGRPGTGRRRDAAGAVRRAAAACALAVSLLSVTAFPQQDVSDLEKRLAGIDAQVKALREKIGEEGKKESTLLSELERISLTKRLIRKELDARSLELEKAARESTVIRKNIDELQVRLERGRRSVEKTLVTLYKYGRFNFLQFLLDAGNISALFSESRHLSQLADYQQGVLSVHIRTMAELRAAGASLEAKREESRRLLQESAQKKLELEQQEAASRALIRQVRTNKKMFEQALAEQKERAEQLKNMMSKLANQELVLPFRFVPFYEKKGKLPWPLAGKIVTRFGLERHRQFKTIVMNNGIEIAPVDERSPVRAVHSGKVVFADSFQGYGNLVIIDHGMNYYTLYGHCAEFLVVQGDFVREEQPIASVGDTGSLSGRSLYLEVRYRTKPLDPLQWLRKR
jgi:septal ring factor EnvC (AmiA/AmiB activator)